MVDWKFLIDDNALASVLPDEYIHFAKPVSGALAVFLNGLAEEKQAAILNQQAELPSGASISQRLALLARSCPVLHKLGQVLARDQRLPLELRLQLQQLESLAPSVPVETIERELTRELGPLERRGVTLVSPAIAEASVAVVIGFRQAGADHQAGVFKLLKPGIEQQLEQELELAEHVGSYLDESCEQLGIPHLDYREAFQQVREKILWEVRLDQEQLHLAQAQEFYADDSRVQIPALFDHCTRRVTAMQRVSGAKVTEHRLDNADDRRRLAELVIDALVAHPVFSKNSQALFHCDPHAGNLFYTDDHRLAILDWSLVGRLGERQRIAVVQILLGAITLHAEQIVRVLTSLSVRPPDGAMLVSIVEGRLRQLRQGHLPGLGWLVGMLDEAVQKARLRADADLMLFRKTLHTLDGVLHDLDAGGSRFDRVLLDQFVRKFVTEWPLRWMSLPNSRDFATRLSNLDLTRWMLATPATALRFWSGQIRDLLSTNQPVASVGSQQE